MKPSVYRLRKQGFKTFQERDHQRQEAVRLNQHYLNRKDFERARMALRAAQPATVEPVAMPPATPERPLEPPRTSEDILNSARGLLKSKPKEPKMAKPKNNGIWDWKYPAADGWSVLKPSFRMTGLICCGIKEYHGIENRWQFSRPYPEGHRRHGSSEYKSEEMRPEDFIAYHQSVFKDALNGRNRPYIVFSEAKAKPNIAPTIVDYIEKHSLGSVAIHGPLKNENSGNQLWMYVWMPDPKAVKAHKVVYPGVDTEAKVA